MKHLQESTHTFTARVLLRARLGVLGLAVAALLAFVGDWMVYQLRGSPGAQVTVTRYLTVPLKGNRTEFDNEGTVQTPCARAIFPQGNLSPCWYLRRHATQADQL